MRRKSKKVKEEAKVDSSSERRSKRSSSRRKKTYDDDEGGSGVEEGRTTEEETNQSKSKDRGNRRYATRGRRQKVEESEEEESQNEEEGVDCEEERSNTVVAEADDGNEQAVDSDHDKSKGLKSSSGVEDVASGEIDDPSACKTDSQNWEMKSGKIDPEDKRGVLPVETLAQDEGNDGEEGATRSHSRKKLKLSRECLHESRKAIPKIRLRLSRNSSGGYETEKVEAKRVESKAAEGGSAGEVFKVESISEEAEEKEVDQDSEPSEAIQSQTVEAEVNKPEVESVDEAESETVEAEVVKSEVMSMEVVETKVVEADSEQLLSTEMAEPVTEVNEVSPESEDKDMIEKVIPDNSNITKEIEEEVSSQTNEVTDSSTVETSQEKESDNTPVVEKTDYVEQVSSEGNTVLSVAEEVKVEDCSSFKETTGTSTPPVQEERVSDEEERTLCEDVGGDDATKLKEERREEEEEVKEVGNDQVSTSNEVGDAKKVEGEGMEVAEGNVEVPVGGVKEEAAEEMEVEMEECNDKDVKGDESSPVNDVSTSKTIEVDVSKDKDGEGDKKSDHQWQNDGDEAADVQRREGESHHKGSSGERISRINRSRLRQEEDKDEDSHSQKRRGRRKRSQSGGEESSSGNIERQQVTVAAPEQPQPKRVTLKRPKLIRATSSSSMKDKETEEKEQQSNASIIRTETDEKMEKEDTEVAATSPNDKEEVQEDAPPEEHKKDNEEEGMKKRRRRWGLNKSQSGPSQTRRAFISISSQSLKGLIPEVKPLPIHELRLSIEKDDIKDICMEEEESCEALGDETIVRMIDTNGQNERTVWAQVVDDDIRPTVHPEAPRVPVVGGGDMNVSTGPVRRISIVSDDAIRLQRSPSPPRHPPSNVLYLSNLVRPFTVQQLKELLARTGTVVEDGFWIDRIKSMCLVQYETEEQARETRHALHGVRWPISNPKRLWVDFSTKDKLDEAKREGNAPPLPSASGPSLSPPLSTLRDDFPRKTEPLRMDGSGLAPTHPSHRGSPGQQGHNINLPPGQVTGGGPAREGDAGDWQQRGRPRPEPPPLRPGANARDFKMSAPVREWDLDKVVQQSPPHPGVHGPLHAGTLDDRRRPEAPGQPGGYRDRAMPSPPASIQDLQARKAKRKEAEAAAAAAAEAPANLLDSLFRKTKATPSIYWLPLTADQIKVKEEIRRQHLAEHERRMAEMKRAAAKERAGRRRRRSSSPRRRSRRRSGGEESGAVRKRPSESIKGRKTGSTSPKK
ncbi:apoptotic chromatin condensation inducer in the nucleus-like isoform X2 [Hetaerina americana]|uniref:apoptotic chromatin condensation inducer in the nucleus-like isoform X2 n=1 Tax=Hetaerina americana TaxID=62018 RepID=UPI003A7F55D6